MVDIPHFKQAQTVYVSACARLQIPSAMAMEDDYGSMQEQAGGEPVARAVSRGHRGVLDEPPEKQPIGVCVIQTRC